MPRALPLPPLLAIGLGTVLACGGDDGVSPPPPPPPPPPVASVEVTAPTTLMAAGMDVPLTAVAKTAAGSPVAGVTFTWQTNAAAVATVNNQGLVHGVGPGPATITATAAGRSGSVALVVRDTASLPATLTGKIERVDLTIAEGRRHRVSGDLVLVADSTLLLAGVLELDPGASVTLYGGKLMRMTGIIAGDSATRLVIGGGRVEIIGEPPPAAGAGPRPGPVEEVTGDLISAGPIHLSGNVLVIGPGAVVRSGPGHPGTANLRDGRPGKPLEIGTVAARSALGQATGRPDPGPTTTLLVDRSLLAAGSGGHGYNVSSRADGSAPGNTWIAVSGAGGKGGDLRIEAALVNLTGSTVQPGGGGYSGEVGAASPIQLLDGSQPNHEGEWGDVTTGRSGDGGDLVIAAGAVLHAEGLTSGKPGGVGGVTLKGGNGREGGPGGGLTISLGVPGFLGQSTVPAGVIVQVPQIPATGLITLQDALSGAGSVDPGLPGGEGGFLAVQEVGGGVTAPALMSFRNVANGGPGYNGCTDSPRINGSNGGRGGERILRATPEILSEQDRNFSGGNGGPGVETAGAGGVRGNQVQGPGGAGPIGLPGAPGITCPEGTGSFTLLVANVNDGLNRSTFSNGSWLTDPSVQTPLRGPVNLERFPSSGSFGNILVAATVTDPGLVTFEINPDQSLNWLNTLALPVAPFGVATTENWLVFTNQVTGTIFSAGPTLSLAAQLPIPGVTNVLAVPGAPLVYAHAGNNLHPIAVDQITGALSFAGPAINIPDLRAIDFSGVGDYFVGVTNPLFGASQLVYQPLSAGLPSGLPTVVTIPGDPHAVEVAPGDVALSATLPPNIVSSTLNVTTGTVTVTGQFAELNPDRVESVLISPGLIAAIYSSTTSFTHGRLCARELDGTGQPTPAPRACETNSQRSRPDSDILILLEGALSLSGQTTHLRAPAGPARRNLRTPP